MKDLPHGHLLPGGLEVSRAGGFCVAVYRCECGRCQTAECPGFSGGLSGGLSVALAERVGWRKIGGRWSCPMCTGNTANLMRVFDRGFTIVEMLVVVAVISVLLSILLPVMSRARDTARATTCRGQLDQLHAATFARWVAQGQGPLPFKTLVWESMPTGLLEPTVPASEFWIEPVPACPTRWQGNRVPYAYVAAYSQAAMTRPETAGDFQVWACPMGHGAVMWSGGIIH